MGGVAERFIEVPCTIAIVGSARAPSCRAETQSPRTGGEDFGQIGLGKGGREKSPSGGVGSNCRVWTVLMVAGRNPDLILNGGCHGLT
jgi:hypothetical protein